MNPQPVTAHLPTKGGGFEFYKAAGKLTGKKALITGGDSGIGRAVAILFSMDGAEISIAYLAAEEDDAQHTKKQVQKNGEKIHLFQTDVTCAKNCKELVDKAVNSMGGINVLVNNAAYQAPKDDISEVSEYVIFHDELVKWGLMFLVPGSNDSKLSTQTFTPISTSPNTAFHTCHPATQS